MSYVFNHDHQIINSISTDRHQYDPPSLHNIFFKKTALYCVAYLMIFFSPGNFLFVHFPRLNVSTWSAFPKNYLFTQFSKTRKSHTKPMQISHRLYPQLYPWFIWSLMFLWICFGNHKANKSQCFGSGAEESKICKRPLLAFEENFFAKTIWTITKRCDFTWYWMEGDVMCLLHPPQHTLSATIKMWVLPFSMIVHQIVSYFSKWIALEKVLTYVCLFIFKSSKWVLFGHILKVNLCY